ncbi:TPA: hypothetical protein I8303_004778 [Aeromonas hydrophila]|nr:hypothetical protein [Aeromonas hydrophila]
MAIQKATLTKAMIVLAALAPLASFAEGADVGAAMGPVQTTILGYIAAAGAGGVVLMAAALGWDVGMGLFKKFFKKGAR